MNTAVVTQLAERVTSLRLDLNEPYDDLDPLTDRVRNAKVVALGSAVRQSHELSTLTDRVMRFLIDQHGFRSLALEGDETASIDLDTYVRTGEGDPLAILEWGTVFLAIRGNPRGCTLDPLAQRTESQRSSSRRTCARTTA